MALLLTREQTPDSLGIPPKTTARILEAGAKLEFSPVEAYIRLGAVEFPQPRHLVLDWEIWPSLEAARERKTQPALQRWTIAPEPTIARREERDSAGKVLAPALVLPTFDALMARTASPAGSSLLEIMDAVRTVIYEIAKEWPEFAGAKLA